LFWSPDGTNGAGLTSTSTVAPTVTDGSTLWVRVTLDVNNGASGSDTVFYTSTDGTTWTQLGTTITKPGTTSIFNSNSKLTIGSFSNDTSGPARGKFFRAQVLNGIGGTVAFDANFETSITSLLQTTFTESSTNAATVTINRSGSTYRSAGITTAGYLYPGATNTFSASATNFFGFGANDSFTAFVVSRQWATPTSNGRYISIDDTNDGVNEIRLYSNATALQSQGRIGGDASAGSVTVNGTAYTSGSLILNGIRRDKANNVLNAITNSTLTSSNDVTTGAITLFGLLRLGARSEAASYQDFELGAAAVFRSALSTAQIRQISNYFANREVYL
jgi:hypothetical protein